MSDRFVRVCAGAVFFLITMLAVGCAAGHNTVSSNPTNPTPTPSPTPTVSPTPTPTPSASPRMMVSDSTGSVIVVNAQTDVITHTISVPSPGKLVSAGGTTLIQSTLASSLSIFDNASETVRFTVPLPALAVDIALTPDGSTAWVAENNGTVQVVNTLIGQIGLTIAVPNVQRLVMGPQGTRVLAFDTQAITFNVMIPSSTLAVIVGDPTLDHPANAVFFADDQNFQLLDCGLECGGTHAGVAGVALNTPGGPFISTPLVVSGATVGLRNGNSFFVAGSPATGLDAGTLQIINDTNNAVSSPLSIADGSHSLMVLASNGRLYIGSHGCTLGVPNAQNFRQGCLDIFDTNTLAVTPILLPSLRPNGDVTGLALVAGRNVIYVVQGGEVDIFDITTNAVSTTITPLNITGTAVGVVQLSP